MSSYQNPSIRIANLQYQKGDFLEAFQTLQTAEIELDPQATPELWLQCLRIQLQCLSELEKFGSATAIYAKLSDFAKTNQDLGIQAHLYHVLAFYHLQLRELDQTSSLLTLSIQAATSAQQIESLARSLMLEVYVNALSSEQKWDQALRSLDKLELINRQANLTEIEIVGGLMRAHIATEMAEHETAATTLWATYEKAQTHGYQILIPSILFQLGRLYKNRGQKNQSQIFFDLSLRGIDPNKHPRQYRLIANEAQLHSSKTSKLQYDFVVSTQEGTVQERHLGVIDFKNQHLLLDLALLFLRNPGQRYSKEQLIATVWKQNYEPNHDNLIYVSIKRLRSLIEPDSEAPRYLLRDRRGYYFDANLTISFEHNQETSV